MKVHHIIPFSLEKNLGKAYNEAMSLIPDGDTALITDYDVMLLTPDARVHIQTYAEMHPIALLTCYTNRIHELSDQGYWKGGSGSKEKDILFHIMQAQRQKEELYSVTQLTENISGFLMVLPKRIWQRFPFDETGKCLGVDTLYWKKLTAAGVSILRMNGIYVWHTYRIDKSITDKNHLI